MNRSEEKNISGNIRREVARDEMAEFERQFRDRERGNALKEGVTINTVFERAEMKKMEWLDIPEQMRSWILKSHGDRTYGVSARPWETNLGQMIFGSKTKNIFYMVKKSGKDFAWSRFWMTEDGSMRCEPINHDSSLSEVINTVAFHEFGEPIRSKTGVAEEVRKKAKKNLRPWEK